MARIDTGPRLSAADIYSRFSEIRPGHSAGERVTVLGHLIGRRPAGQLLFLDLYDRSGKIQLLAGRFTDNYEKLSQVTGDIEAGGTVIRTKAGELSVRLLWWESA